jgi:hypothetical protein
MCNAITNLAVLDTYEDMIFFANEILQVANQYQEKTRRYLQNLF